MKFRIFMIIFLAVLSNLLEAREGYSVFQVPIAPDSNSPSFLSPDTPIYRVQPPGMPLLPHNSPYYDPSRYGITGDGYERQALYFHTDEAVIEAKRRGDGYFDGGSTMHSTTIGAVMTEMEESGHRNPKIYNDGIMNMTTGTSGAFILTADPPTLDDKTNSIAFPPAGSTPTSLSIDDEGIISPKGVGLAPSPNSCGRVGRIATGIGSALADNLDPSDGAEIGAVVGSVVAEQLGINPDAGAVLGGVAGGGVVAVAGVITPLMGAGLTLGEATGVVAAGAINVGSAVISAAPVVAAGAAATYGVGVATTAVSNFNSPYRGYFHGVGCNFSLNFMSGC